MSDGPLKPFSAMRAAMMEFMAGWPACRRFVKEPSVFQAIRPATMLPAMPWAYTVFCSSSFISFAAETAAPMVPQVLVGWKPW